MTEIPEHLLKRSRDRRSALGLGGESGGDTPAGAPAADAVSSTPATTTASTPTAPASTAPAARKAPAAPATTPPPKRDPPYVVAAKTRAKIPFWAVAALSLMPIWAFMYVRSVTAPPVEAAGPLGIGASVYSGQCSSCHLANGAGVDAGGVGRALYNGEVDKTFPHIEDQLRFVYFGTGQYQIAGIAIYGNPDRPGGAHATASIGQMPAQGSTAGGSLTDEEILAVVCHERYDLNGPDRTTEPWATEFANWCADDAPAFRALEAGTSLADLANAGLPIDVADMSAPAEGSS